MRLIVMFDLPVMTKAERRAATQFRNFLLNDGYYMMQFSIYIRLCNGMEAANTHRERLLKRQFEAMEILCGEKILDLDEAEKENKVLVF